MAWWVVASVKTPVTVPPRATVGRPVPLRIIGRALPQPWYQGKERRNVAPLDFGGQDPTVRKLVTLHTLWSAWTLVKERRDELARVVQR